MGLDHDVKQQLNEYLKLMEGPVVLQYSIGETDAGAQLKDLIEEIGSMSTNIHIEKAVLERSPSFSVNRPGEVTGIVFAGIPLGHEFSSLVLALLQVSGRPPKVEPETTTRIKGLKGSIAFETYVSLSCHNCPDVVQALNLMSLLNPEITHTMIDGGLFQEEITDRNIMGVPAVFLNGEFFSGGRITLEEILEKLGSVEDSEKYDGLEPFDVLVIGGGPAGASAAIYAARKGIRTGLVAERFGGQVGDTVGIENLIGTLYTEGSKVVADLESHVKNYPVTLLSKQRVVSIEKESQFFVTLASGAVLKAKTVIVTTGARWRNVNVPGESELKNKGVAYCPHCDGPLFKGKDVAVIGGGNSGIEAAIDLAGLVKHVTVLEFMPELKADAVLQNKLYSLPNVTVYKNVQTKAIEGDDKVEGIRFLHRDTEEEQRIDLQGVFVQIGLVPNTEWLGEQVEKTKMGEIVVDSKGMSSLPGLFAAGDCTDSAYKQIIISMGSGATAALGAFDYLMRQE